MQRHIRALLKTALRRQPIVTTVEMDRNEMQLMRTISADNESLLDRFRELKSQVCTTNYPEVNNEDALILSDYLSGNLCANFVVAEC